MKVQHIYKTYGCVCVCVCTVHYTHITCLKVVEEEVFSADSPLARPAPYSYSAGSKIEKETRIRVRKWGKKKEEEKNRRVLPQHPGVMMLTHIFFLKTAPLWEYQVVGLAVYVGPTVPAPLDHQLFF